MPKEQKNEPERCVVCGKLTEYMRDTPISERIGYIEGGGQLCAACFTELHGGRKPEIIEH